MASAVVPPSDHLVWSRTSVDGRPALYGVAGEGLPVLFLHGWGLGQHAYKRALKRLVQIGCQVYAPALPGFGGTAELPGDQLSFAGYADWVAAFLDAVGVTEQVFLVGHSFGGGVSIKFAHDHADRVRYLVLVNSLGGSMAGRPLWDWGIHFPGDVFPFSIRQVLPVVLEDALPNVIRNPRAMWKVANLARTADLTPELEQIKENQLPVVVLWGDKDKIIPKSAFDALCTAIGKEGSVIEGSHSWLLADPEAFVEVITNDIEVAQMARSMEAANASLASTRRRRRLAALPRLLPSLRAKAPSGDSAKP
ncbi:MAG TPA: alpha/beta hydrolase [Acidimicrobiales bacterium]|nr:alpha/beta hydrolase [Acidimicrobiales bacterium]